MSDPTVANGDIVTEINPETGKQTHTKIQRARINTPRLIIEVTQDIIDRAVRAESRTCMIAEAIKAKHPWAHNVQVDWAEARVTDTEKNLRYVYRTPRLAAVALLAFDQGVNIEPFHTRTVQAMRVVRYSKMKIQRGGEPAAPKGDRAAKARAVKAYSEQVKAARGEPDEHGQVLTPPEYLAELAQRLDDPIADLGPPAHMLDVRSSTEQASNAVVVGGSTRPTSARLPKPGQLKFNRRFGAREFWKGDGSGIEGVIHDREEGKAFRAEQSGQE